MADQTSTKEVEPIGEAERLCGCGSGLAAAVCCELDLANATPADPSPENLARLSALVEAAANGTPDAAVKLAIAILSDQPTWLDALSALFLIRRGQHEHKAAMALIRRLTRLAPDQSRYVAHLIETLVAEGAWDEAEAAARKIVRLAPDDAQAHATLGLIFSMRELLLEGEFHLCRALALCDGRPPRLLMQLATNLESQGRLDAARPLYEELADLAATSREAQFALARLEGVAGDLDGMTKRLARMEVQAPASPAMVNLKALAAYDRGDFDRALNLYEQAGSAGEGLRAQDRYLIGQALDKQGRYDEAFAQFEYANAGHSSDSGAAFDSKRLRALSQATHSFLTQRAVELMPTAPQTSGSQPLFIVGFPRSGTTMLEQSLSMHSQIMAGGELASLSTVAHATGRLLASPMAYPLTLSELWMGDQHHQIGLLRDHYLNSARRSVRHQTGSWFTDKALSHELHLGLAHLLFPQSPIIHIIRHPLDVIVSNYANGLPHGGYRGGIKEIAEYYLLMLETASHFQRIIPNLKGISVKYEDIVDDQQHWTRTILNFIGEPFEPECLRFHENQRRPLTLSRQQVREPINAKSKFRYKNYMKHLEPAIDVLEPAIARLGYRI